MWCAVVLFVVVLAGAVTASGARAAGPLVQVREPGTRLIAHRYEAPSAAVQKLSVSYALAATVDSVTAFDSTATAGPTRPRTLAIGDVPGAQAVTMRVTALGSVAGATGKASSATLRAGAARSGTTANLRVGQVRARRSGKGLVISWAAPADRVAGYEVKVTPRKGKAIILRTRAKVHRVKLTTAPAAGFTVTVRAPALKV